MKKLYLVHRWDGNASADWYPWLHTALGDTFDARILEMPNPATPNINEWVEFLTKNIEKTNDEIFLVGHSVGCQTILRFLEKSEDIMNIKAVILVAPWVALTPEAIEGVEDIAKPWLTLPLNWKTIKTKCSHFIAIFSDNDQFVSQDNVEIFRTQLGAKIIVEKNKGHMTEEDGITKLPSVISVLNVL